MSDYFHCPLCGFEFARPETPCHQGCPLGQICNLICCPNCRYEFPPDRPSWFRRWFRRPAPVATEGVRDLTQVPEGTHGELVCLNCAHASRRNALAVYGLVPGSRVILQQKRPSFVVRVGETELALDAGIAKEILVRPVTPSPCPSGGA